MKRGDFYRVYKGNKNDPKSHRVFMIVSRQSLVDSSFSTVVCAPVYSKFYDITTQVEVGIEEGMKHDSAIYCDELISLPKRILTDYLGSISDDKIELINAALRVALSIG